MMWIVLACGVYSIIGSFVMQTENIRSALIFRVIPFFLGAGCVVYALQQFNII